MKIALVSNLNSGIGLLRDYELLREFLLNQHHTIFGVQYDEPADDLKVDLAIFLEVAPRALLNISDRRWLFANPEWMKPDKIQIVERNFEKIFAKTHEAKRVLDPVFPGKVHYTGFLSRDQFDPKIKRQPWFLHVGGNSTIRGTQAIIDAFRWKKNGKELDAHLIVVSSALKQNNLPLNIVHFDKVDEVMLKHLQNQCMYHLYPSATEGFGHAIHEGLSCSSVVMVPDAPPMNELEEVYQLPATKTGKQALADLYEVSALDIYQGIEEVRNSDLYQHTVGRVRFVEANEAFKEAFAAHLEETPAPAIITRERKKTGKSIAFIGNFEAEHSTENQILWALEQRLGYEVEKLQENRVNQHDIRAAVVWNQALIWVKTPGWLQVSDDCMVELLNICTHEKVPTISIHLDKFWGIPEREKQIGMHPFWLTDHVWTADGSRPEDFEAREVNHHWMRPAVSEVYCHPGIFRKQHECDVCFVGAKEYHREYPFRAELIDFLEREYGDRFKHVQGIRGHDLNDVYASAKVVVGDCIFAGTPRYWSDRVPETVGRYGNLLHPKVEGLDVQTWLYEPQNLQSLKEAIALQFEVADFLRQNFVIEAAKRVRRHHTWTCRMREILTEAGL